MKIFTSNLVSALNIAISTQRKIEKEELKYTRDSALVAGWVKLKEELVKSDDGLLTIEPTKK